MDNITILINGRFNTWIFNALKEEYFNEFKMAIEEFAIKPFESIEEFLNELIYTSLDPNLLEEFVSRFNAIKLKENCPLLKELLNLIRENSLPHYDLFAIISEFSITELSFITKEAELLIKKNNSIIVQKEVDAFFDNSEWYNMEEFEENNIAYSNAKKRLEKLFNQHPTCFNSSTYINSVDDWLHGAYIGIGSGQKIGGVFYCPPNLSELLKNYEVLTNGGFPVSHPRAFSIRLNNIASVHYSFEAFNFDLTKLSFLELSIMTEDVWSYNDHYSFSEIFYEDIQLNKSYEIYDEKGIRLFFNDSDESNFYLLMKG